jgi:signal transduction histidine kinase/ActR/RegA family two-component response regulator
LDDAVLACLAGGGVTGELMRATDWAATAVGPAAAWPASLKTIVAMLLRSRHPMFLWWGPELVQFYNDAYLPSFGVGKHPAAMGQRGADCWQEVWPIIWPQIDDVMSRGQASWNEDQLVPIFRNGRIEEVYWTYGYSPVIDESGAVGGTLVVCTETTARVLAERRLRSQRLLADAAAAVTEPAALFAAAAQQFRQTPADIPFALFYAADPAGALRLVASVGLDAAAEQLVDAQLRQHWSRPTTEAPIPSEVLPTPAGLDAASALFVTRLSVPAMTTPTRGLVVFGLSPRLPFDSRYRDHLVHLAAQLSSVLSRLESVRAQLAETSARRNLLMQAPVATALVTGPTHVIELANPLFQKMVGRKLVGKTYLEVFPELAGTALPGILDHVYRTGEPFVTNELALPLDRDGDGVVEEAFFKFNLEPMRDGAGHIYGMMAVALDISESVSARRAIERAHREREGLLAELESANRAKDEFLAMLGHELRNPLSPIVSALQLIRRRNEGPIRLEEQIIERQVTHLVRLVDDLLDISKITRGKVELKKERVELRSVLTKAIEMASVLFEQRGHRLDVDVPPRIIWYGDPVRLAQVVANLLTNAARYTDAGGRIELSAASDGAEIVIRVKDNGIGIGPEMLPRIFDLFVQAKRSVDRSEGGLGLGLTLAKTLVTMHGGSIVALSDGIGQGSELVIRLPVATSEVAAADEAAPRIVSVSGRRVLLVDDNVDAADMLADVLRLAGHAVTVAYDPLIALEQLAPAAPDIAVLDIGLPGMDGYELAVRVKEAAPACRLVALTGYGQERDIERSKAAGFDVHLVKPADIEQLLEIIAANELNRAV